MGYAQIWVRMEDGKIRGGAIRNPYQLEERRFFQNLAQVYATPNESKELLDYLASVNDGGLDYASDANDIVSQSDENDAQVIYMYDQRDERWYRSVKMSKARGWTDFYGSEAENRTISTMCRILEEKLNKNRFNNAVEVLKEANKMLNRILAQDRLLDIKLSACTIGIIETKDEARLLLLSVNIISESNTLMLPLAMITWDAEAIRIKEVRHLADYTFIEVLMASMLPE